MWQATLQGTNGCLASSCATRAAVPSTPRIAIGKRPPGDLSTAYSTPRTMWIIARLNKHVRTQPVATKIRAKLTLRKKNRPASTTVLQHMVARKEVRSPVRMRINMSILSSCMYSTISAHNNVNRIVRVTYGLRLTLIGTKIMLLKRTYAARPNASGGIEQNPSLSQNSIRLMERLVMTPPSSIPEMELQLLFLLNGVTVPWANRI